MDKKKKKIEELKSKIKECKNCELYKTRTNPGVGEGSLNAEVMFIAEAPGFWEDKEGKPFVGKAGEILDQLLSSINIKRNQVYITNILKCRPPENRNPNKEEIRVCTSYLNEQIDIIKPKIICCFGNFATEFILKKFGLKNEIQGISKIHGKVFKIQNLYGKLKIISLFHPASALYNSNLIQTLKKDISKLKEV